MPHIIVEYSDNIGDIVDSSEILVALHKKVVDSGLFSPDAVKARSIGFNQYVLPEGANHFVHVTISILSGRTQEQRKTLSNGVFEVLREKLAEVHKQSVDIQEMDKETYCK